ncbi:SIMPL domain-containing protein [Mycolicibacterium arabiense]|uniref:SIMPL domain-containing protein n=1 Tax=Mycolicibacterium arabiense TaxID=1286181 RepID=A0A7I7S956_9MYCO|nr:SIMPL domain-containing protein [Mycolicibacterium arabiense]MBJ7383989.1 SIMPL domain-containing protein [Mycolicibacterium sp.]MCV7376562.1 SIMPL domain-containing protein [Mycolicibacterium arabiense]BBY52525.1 SIMPL domain-containing protein [Mycolicibacterium arabiense]
MTDVQITVAANHTISERPQRATVSASIDLNGPRPDAVFEAMSVELHWVRQSIDEMYDPSSGPVTWFAIDQIRRSSYRVRDQEDEPPRTVFTAAAQLEVKFSDFEALSKWIWWTASVDSLRVQTIDWALTAARRSEIERDARMQAVRDAVQRAQDYADALDLGRVAARQVEDRHRYASDEVTTSNRVRQSEVDDWHLRPRHIRVGVDVKAVFTASARPAAAGR